MVDAWLQRGSGSFLSSGGTQLVLYNVRSEVIKKSNSLIRVPFPMADSNDSIMADLLGASRDIVVEGHASTGDNVDIYKFAKDLVSIKDENASTLINGDQSDTGGGFVGYGYYPVSLNMSSTGALTGTLQTTIRVYVNDVNVTYEGGDPNKVKYSLTLYEGSSTNSF